MAIQVRRGKEADFDPSKMLPGEWAVSLDTKYVRMCFAPSVCLRMATYEAFEADMEQIRDILEEAKTIQEAVTKIQTEIYDTSIVVEDYAFLAKSYAVGGTGTRENENADNAKYYYEQTKQISQGLNGIVPMGTVAFADLPTTDIVDNAMYNVSDAFTSDERFNDGGGIYYGPGNNVIWTAEGKWDVTASSSVTGIKGEAEEEYRVGNVNITAENIGLGTVKQDIAEINSNLDILSLIEPMNNAILYNNWCSANILGGKLVVLNLLISGIALSEIGVKQILNIPSQYAPTKNIRISAEFFGSSGEEAGDGHIDIQTNGIIQVNCRNFIRSINWAQVNVTYVI